MNLCRFSEKKAFYDNFFIIAVVHHTIQTRILIKIKKGGLLLPLSPLPDLNQQPHGNG